ncbi:DNA primase, partial [Halorubrum sp. SS5]
MTWRQATREEIYAYYAEEFPRYVDDLPEFITGTGPKQYAVAFREDHPVRNDEVPDKDFIRRDTWQTNPSGDRTTAEFNSFEDVVEFIRHPARNDPLGRSEFALADPEVLEQSDPRPDAVYYALDHWERPWVLLVDIDAK